MSPLKVCVMRTDTVTLPIGPVSPATGMLSVAPTGLLSGIGTGPVAANGTGVPAGEPVASV